MCFDFLYVFFGVTFLILRRNDRDMAINVHMASRKVPVIIIIIIIIRF
jgi:hypothetical protein